MKSGLWYDFRNPIVWRHDWPSLYEDLFRQIRRSESVGFESVWLSEHHFTEDGYMPSVFPMLAAIAAQTSRIRLGTAVCLAPLHYPLRLAEDSAVVDVLSSGCLEVGIAPGYRRLEFDVLDIRKNERGRRTDETIEILRAAWTGEEVTYTGAAYGVDRVTVQPRPAYVSRQIPIHIGGSSPAAARRAGRFSCNFMPDVGTGVKLPWLPCLNMS